MNGVRDFDGAFVLSLEDIDHEGTHTIKAHQFSLIFEAVFYGGEIRELELGAIDGGDDDIGEVLLLVGLALSPDHDGAGGGLHRAGGEGERRAADGIGEILNGEAVVAQFFVIGLDGDFEGAGAAEVGAGDLGEVEDILLDAAREVVEFHFRKVPSDGDGDDLTVV